MNIRTVAYVALAGAAALFGVTFVVVKDALDVIAPLAFVGWRFLVAAIVLIAIARPRRRAVWIDGAIAGGVLFIGYASQTIGLEQTSASNSGLITGLYVVFTPVLAAVFKRVKPAPTAVGGAAVSIVGLGLLTLEDGLSLSDGDLWTLVCAIAFAVHIVLLATMAPRHDVLRFTAVQLMTTAALALVFSLALEDSTTAPSEAWIAILATGLLVTCGAFLIQVWSQTIIGPSRTAIVLALEPLFAVATAAVVLGERLDSRSLIGAGLMLVGTYIVLALAPEEETDLRTAEALSEAH